MRQKYAIICMTMLVLVPFFATICSAQPSVSDHAPIFYFEGEETCYPIDAQYHLNYSQYTCINPLLEETCFYDNTQGTINDDGVINHYQSMKSNYSVKVYYRTYTSGTTYVIQYWMFYAFNKGELNQHEGDWEMVQIVFGNDEPSWVGYSQHHSGQKATWAQVEKEGTNIKVYVARGSHANYLRSYSGKLGIASDIVGANGMVLNPSDYELEYMEDETWIDFKGRWGEVADDEADAAVASVLGQAGPEGPQYRTTMGGVSLWDDPVAWGNSLLPAIDSLFILELLVYNFVLIFILITIAIIALMAFGIYRRHKKYGLGPRFVSIFYINGFNLHSIGNILCIVGIILAFIGLFNPWYQVSYGVSGTGITTFQTEGMIDLLTFDGINGLQITIPGTSGPIPMGSFDLPFSFFIAVGLIFMIIATIGIHLSKKLGTKYIFRGIRLFIPFILIIILIVAIGSIVPSIAGEGDTISTYLASVINPITSSPFGGESTTSISEAGITAQVNTQWGLGSGAWLLLIAGIIMLVAGILELMAKTQFFATKIPLPGQGPARMPVQPPPTPPQKQEPPKDKSKGNFCTGCGAKLEENSTFCVECGKKIGK